MLQKPPSSMKSTDRIPPWHILPVIVFAQFAGTSLWFAGNAVAADLQREFALHEGALGNLISAVQFGFITGTLIFAFLSVADRFSPARVFLFSAFAGAIFNICVIWLASGLTSLLAFRFLTGFFLAGIYPVGMKISSDWYGKGLGKALGYLVGALVLGKAFPFLLKAFAGGASWQAILLATSGTAAAGGLLLYLTVGDGPNRRPAPRFEWDVIPKIFRFSEFRSAAFGYFGHMWELYAFWTFIPVMLAAFNSLNGQSVPVSGWSFAIIGMGALGCVAGGYISLKAGSPKVAFFMLLTSGLLCLLSPLLFHLPEPVFLAVVLIWGFAVVGDSPQFSTVVARTAPPEYIGTALTIVNCIGFALTIFSIQLLNHLGQWMGPQWWFLFLVPGPVFGLLHIRKVMGERVRG